MNLDRLPVTPRLCFNWLPTYRYGLFAYKALQQSCALLLKEGAKGLELGGIMESKGLARPLTSVRPVALDSLLQTKDHNGYINWQFADALEIFSDGKPYYALSENTALIVTKKDKEKDLLGNVIPYMTSATTTLEASLAVSGCYTGVEQNSLITAHQRRKSAADALCNELAKICDCPAENILLHLNAVGGIIEGTLRYLHKNKPGFTTCALSPEYWDFMRFILTYSAQGLRLIPGRDQGAFPADAWLAAISDPKNDFAYLSYTSNPVGTVIPEDTFLEALNIIPDDTLFFIDCTSIDIKERSSTDFVKRIIKKFPHKNLLITKSFSKEYELGDLRVGYAVFTRRETARAIWPYMAGYPAEQNSRIALAALKQGYSDVMARYTQANLLLREMAAKHPKFHFTGDCSNYTLVFCKSPEQCVEIKQRLQEEYGDKIYPGELPMQGGGDLGLGKGEVDLTSMKDIPFLSPQALRLVVTPESIQAFEKVLNDF
jgi:histidinol-phosphate/aromatic aminotransferase/cobyric acid decarboxylase-like protein